ncbi:carboxymuconolactone decarboxylase family protein [Mesorhizobium sp. ASY16-5R]|uniref:carboxymuconolactone decarboxylase family protein n=1 Tax=Mesorhizobium sp. ASY16-5R TaxID=3445772 RepID=UPI003FA11B04
MRLPEIDIEAMDAAQKAVYDHIAGGARGRVAGPFLALLHSPELAARVEQLGVFVRFECAVPQRQRELAILAVARHWRADYEWFVHAPIAEKQGLPRDAIDTLGMGGTPQWPTEEDRVVADFCGELLRSTQVSDATYGRATELFGVRGTTDLTGLIGYYSLLALTINAHQVGVPADADIPWKRVRMADAAERRP